MRPRSIIRFIATFFAIINPAGYIGNGRFEERNDVFLGYGGSESQVISGVDMLPLPEACNKFYADGDPRGSKIIIGESHDKRSDTARCIDALSYGKKHKIFLECGQDGVKFQCSQEGFPDIVGRECFGFGPEKQENNKFYAKNPKYRVLLDFKHLYDVYRYTDKQIKKTIKEYLTNIKSYIKVIGDEISKFNKPGNRMSIKKREDIGDKFIAEILDIISYGKSLSDIEKWEAMVRYLTQYQQCCEEILGMKNSNKNKSFKRIIDELLNGVLEKDGFMDDMLKERDQKTNKALMKSLEKESETDHPAFFVTGAEHTNNREVREKFSKASDSKGNVPYVLRIRR
jgi:hypothetical protein